jgi:hypothetical protein
VTELTTTQSLPELAATANRAHHEIEELAVSAVAKAREAGEALREAKEQIPHGQWGEWVRDNFAGSVRTAQLYMKIAAQWPELEKTQRVADMPLRQVAGLLEKPRTDRRQTAPEQMRLVQHPAVRGLVPGPEFEKAYPGLVASIREIGLRHPIVVDQHGRVIDGWLRYHACLEAGVPVEIEVKHIANDEDAWNLWWSCNMMRQHLTPDQRAMIAVSLERLEAEMNAAVADMDDAAGDIDWEGSGPEEIPKLEQVVELADKAIDAATGFRAACLNRLDG